jgi:hypothetical protein
MKSNVQSKMQTPEETPEAPEEKSLPPPTNISCTGKTSRHLIYLTQTSFPNKKNVLSLWCLLLNP